MISAEQKLCWESYKQDELDNLFIDACEENNVEIIKCLLEDKALSKRPDIKATDYSALWYAARNYNFSLLDYYVNSPLLKENIILEEAIEHICDKNFIPLVNDIIFNFNLRVTPRMEQAISYMTDNFQPRKLIELEKRIEIQHLTDKLEENLQLKADSAKKVKI